jgi:hypothetical protein
MVSAKPPWMPPSGLEQVRPRPSFEHRPPRLHLHEQDAHGLEMGGAGSSPASIARSRSMPLRA